MNMINRTLQPVVTEVTGATVIVKPAGPTEFAVFQHSHAGVREATDFAVLCVMRRDFHYGAPDDFIRAEEAELDANNGLRFGAMRKSRHTWYLSWFFRRGWRGDPVKFGVPLPSL